MRNIVLIGMPGCGKSTIGKKLAKSIHRQFFDVDEEIVQLTGQSIQELFAVSEEHFRNKETEATKLLAQKLGVVISCGGGVVKRDENMEALRATGTVFLLNRSPEDICTEVNVATRPLLTEGREKIFQLYKERIRLYVQAADYIVDVQEPFENTIPKIMNFFK